MLVTRVASLNMFDHRTLLLSFTQQWVDHEENCHYQHGNPNQNGSDRHIISSPAILSQHVRWFPARPELVGGYNLAVFGLIANFLAPARPIPHRIILLAQVTSKPEK